MSNFLAYSILNFNKTLTKYFNPNPVSIILPLPYSHITILLKQFVVWDPINIED